MGISSSGQISMLGIAREKEYMNCNSTSTPTGPISAADLWNGTKNCGQSGTNWEDTNSGQKYTTYPKPAYAPFFAPSPTNENRVAPKTPVNLSYAQWYNYDQDRKGTWFAESNFPICRAFGVSFGDTNSAVFTLGSIKGLTPSVNGGFGAQYIAGCCKSSTTIEWNGSSFSTGGSTPISANMGTAGETSTSGIIVRPNISISSNSLTTCQGKAFTYNGTTFSTKTLSCNVSNSNYMYTAQNPSSGMTSNGFGSAVALHVGGAGTGCRVMQYLPDGGNVKHRFVANMNAGCRILGGVIGIYPQGDATTMGGYGAALNPRCDTEQYNGASWSTKANMSSGRFGFMVGSEGSKDGRRCVWGGLSTQSYSGALCSTEDFNGSSWSTRTNYPIAGIAGAFHAGNGKYNGGAFSCDCALSVGGFDKAGSCSPSGNAVGYAINKAYSFCENSQRYANVT